jgi:thioredoxin-like negative regulator of GroEL
MPIVHGLERKYTGRVDFLYLHVGESRTSQVRERLGFVATPQIVLLDGGGRKVREWIGLIDESSLTTGLDALLPR